MVLLHSARKFPNFDKDEWLAANSEKIEAELVNYRGLFKEESVESAFQRIIVEQLFLESLVKDIAGWREDFLEYLARAIETAEKEQVGANDSFNKGRLTILSGLLEWF